MLKTDDPGRFSFDGNIDNLPEFIIEEDEIELSRLLVKHGLKPIHWDYKQIGEMAESG